MPLKVHFYSPAEPSFSFSCHVLAAEDLDVSKSHVYSSQSWVKFFLANLSQPILKVLRHQVCTSAKLPRPTFALIYHSVLNH